MKWLVLLLPIGATITALAMFVTASIDEERKKRKKKKK